MALRTPLTVSPHMYIGDSTGRPLDNGMVYFGLPDQDPEHYPINIFSDDDLTIPVSQPVRTKGGYLNDNKGDMAEIHAKELIYSVKVLDQYGRKIFYKGQSMRSNWNDDVIIRIDEAILETSNKAEKVARDITLEAIDGIAIDSNLVNDALVKVMPVAGGVMRSLRSKNSDTVTPYDFGAIGDGLEHKLSERFNTLAQAQAQYPTAQSLNDTIDLVALESFFAYCQANYVVAEVNIKAYINRTLKIIGTSVSTYTGSLDLINLSTTSEIKWLMQINAWAFNFKGRLSAKGNDSVAAKDRKQLGGILVGKASAEDAGSANSVNIGSVSVSGFRDFGLNVVNDAMFFNCDEVFSSYIGAIGAAEGLNSHSATIVERGVSYVNLFNDQYTVLKMSSLPPGDNLDDIFAVHNNEIYAIRDINRTDSTIKIYPYIDPNALSNDVRYIYGVAANIYGDNTNAGRINRYYSIVCGIAAAPNASYGFTSGTITAESCGIGVLFGKEYSHIVAANLVQSLYLEDCVFDINFASAVDTFAGYDIQAAHGIDYKKVVDTFRWRVQPYGDLREVKSLPNLKVGRNSITHNSAEQRQLVYGNLTGCSQTVRHLYKDTESLVVQLNWDIYQKFGYQLHVFIVPASEKDLQITVDAPNTLIDTIGASGLIKASDTTQIFMVQCVYKYGGKGDIYIVRDEPKNTGGATAQRPTKQVLVGRQYFDTTLNKLIVWNGTAWVDANGTAV